MCGSPPPLSLSSRSFQASKYDSGNGSLSACIAPGGGSTLLVPSLQVADEPAQATVYEVSCPHCRKAFREELLSGPAARYTGFKCPHCRLFVPLDRASSTDDTT